MNKFFLLLIIILNQIIIYSCNEKTKNISSQNKKIDTLDKDSILIKYGYSFGECIGYCYTEYNFHNYRIEKIQLGPASDNYSKNYPTKKKFLIIERKKYLELISLLNYDVFLKLDERIGCPDCKDGGAEWIEIQIGNRKKKVLFEFGSDIKQISQFLSKIRLLVMEK